MKKFLSMLLTVALVVSMLCLPAVADTTLEGDGTKENPYLIKTADDFAKATAILESTYYEVVTTNDSDEVTAVKRWCGISADGMSQIYFQLAPASGDSITVTAPNGALLLSQDGGTYEDTEIVIRQQFAGVLDGNGATINFGGETVTLSGTPNGAIVDYLCGTAIETDEGRVVHTAKVQNLTISNVTVDATCAKSGQAAILAGSVDGVSTIYDVHVVNSTMDSSVAQIHNKGALVGKHNSGTLNIQDCSFSGELKDTKAKDRNGGLVGSLASANNANIKNCVVNANLTLKNTAYAGGIVGFVDSATAGTVTVSGCSYTGTLTVTANGGVGGIVGGFIGTKTMKVQNCTANVTIAASATAKAGGILAWFNPNADTGKVQIDNCSATVTATCSADYVGGIVGYVAKAGTLEVSDVTANGSITASAGAYPGGIVGYVKATATVNVDNAISNVDITGKANSTHYAGGIVGRVQAAATVTVNNCMNTGAVSASHVGGIVAQASVAGAVVTITNCINTGTMTDIRTNGAACVGGIMGSTQANPTVVILNSHNRGTIVTNNQSTDYAGGIFGAIQDSATTGANLTIQNCTNDGTFNSTSDYVGAILGAALDANGAIYNISNCIDFNEDVDEFVSASSAATVTAAGCANVAGTYAPASTANLFQVLTGARIRVSSEGVEDNGIRFDIAVDKALVKALEDAGYEVELKSLMALASSVNVTNFTKETLNAMGEKFSDSKNAATVKNDGTYAAALINFSAEQYATEFACVGYLVATKGNETITFYTAYDADNARSIEYVANAALADNENGQYDNYLDVLNAFAGKN